MLNDEENTTTVILLHEKPRLSEPNKTMTKEQSAMIYFDLKQKTGVILSHNGSSQQSN